MADTFSDVILTTLKPQLKNVTAEDVASSLYYFHLNSDHDAQLLAESSSIIAEEDEPAEKEEPVPRKPLPKSAISSIDLNRQMPVVQQPPTAINLPLGVGRKALSPSVQTPKQPRELDKEQIQRKPLGPRPLVSDASPNRDPFPVTGNQPGIPAQHNRSDSRISTQNDESRQSLGSYNPINLSKASIKSFLITIIRRDPSSGAQWNIGTVLGEQEAESSRSKKLYFDFSIHLTTPGYNQFTELQTKRNTADASTITRNRASVPEFSHIAVQPVPELGFFRQICMEGSSFWDRSRHHVISDSDASSIYDTADRRCNLS